ncbi:MAG: hypothetical protein WA964_17125 [Ilumatobacter sp.]|uniref:hypothetical protein n=1 Tax=Ilumatobacter sp. TaxID=1967498 RepID=UPI003C706F69
MSDDTDDQIHENSLLASAYLDGEATTDERALVETSPDTLAEVAALTQVSSVLAATAPIASLSEREAHLAGALDVWERMSDLERAGEATPAAGVDAAAAAALITPVSTSEGRRQRGGRGKGKRSGSFGASQWFLGAAATLVVVAGAAAVFRGILAEEDASDDVTLEAVADEGAELSEVEANETAEVLGENVGADVEPDADLIEGEAQADPDSEGGLFAGDEAMEESDAAASAPAPAEQPSPAAEIDRVDLETPDDLADYGSLVVIGFDGGPLTTDDTEFEPPFNSCEAEFGIERLLAPARYQGENVFVGVDLDDDIVYAYTEDCTLVESVPLPTTPPPTQP